MAAAASMRATSPASFTRRSSSTSPLGRHELGVGEPASAKARCCAHVTCSASRPRPRADVGHRAAHDLLLLLGSVRSRCAASTPGGAELFGRLVA